MSRFDCFMVELLGSQKRLTDVQVPSFVIRAKDESRTCKDEFDESVSPFKTFICH